MKARLEMENGERRKVKSAVSQANNSESKINSLVPAVFLHINHSSLEADICFVSQYKMQNKPIHDWE